ncbi:hypothetical protein CVT26_002459 [Gymnopilus dilepis]|uniref:Uncharacterized protein n=1 Tax=Gymnopilus dilepis TaxID=231916 RepID=A0A409VT28_9AGAR|nr:hypothetical protein CVT26_002459 [Gymnopilus dilepis]
MLCSQGTPSSDVSSFPSSIFSWASSSSQTETLGLMLSNVRPSEKLPSFLTSLVPLASFRPAPEQDIHSRQQARTIWQSMTCTNTKYA